MQSSSNNEEGYKAAKGGEDETKIGAADEDGSSVTRTISIPTKTQDGGADEQETSQGQEARQYLGSSSSSTLQDSFRTMSDNDTRMLSLLGIGPAENPNDGEEQEDWRQLTGFLGLGQEAEAQADEGNEDTMSPRKTRLSYELHLNAFTNMWLRRGELNGNGDRGGQQQQDG